MHAPTGCRNPPTNKPNVERLRTLGFSRSPSTIPTVSLEGCLGYFIAIADARHGLILATLATLIFALSTTTASKHCFSFGCCEYTRNAMVNEVMRNRTDRFLRKAAAVPVQLFQCLHDRLSNECDAITPLHAFHESISYACYYNVP